MKFLNFSRVLCLSPHPDDVEYSMLGSMIKSNEDTHFDVLCLTIGGAKGFDPTNELNRRDEIKNLHHSYVMGIGCDNINFDFSDYDYFEDLNEPGWINYIENKYSIGTYNAIFVPPQEDSMFEHRFVNKFGSALTRGTAVSLIEYNTPSTLNTWKSNIFIDVRNQYEDKLKLLTNFTSQQSKSYFQRNTLDAFHSNFQCKKRGVDIVEQFKVIELFEREDK